MILAPLSFFLIRNDFAVRRAAEAALAESEARFRAAAEGSPDAFYILRAVRDSTGAVIDFEFVDLNARTEALLGHPREGILGQRLCELVPANRRFGFFDRYRQVMESGSVLYEEVQVPVSEFHAPWVYHQVVSLQDGVAITRGTSPRASRKARRCRRFR